MYMIHFQVIQYNHMWLIIKQLVTMILIARKLHKSKKETHANIFIISDPTNNRPFPI